MGAVNPERDALVAEWQEILASTNKPAALKQRQVCKCT